MQADVLQHGLHRCQEFMQCYHLLDSKARIFTRLDGSREHSEPSRVLSIEGPRQTPLPNDPLVQAPTEEQFNKDGDEERRDNPSMKELPKQIDSLVEVIDVDNLTSNVALEGPNDPKINLVPTPLTSGKASSVPL